MFEPYLMGQYQYPWQGVTMAEVKVLVDSYK